MDRSLGCTTYDEKTGIFDNDSTKNPLLEQDVKSVTVLYWLTKVNAQDINQFATAAFAELLAGLVGGKVAEIKSHGTAVFSAPQRIILMDDGSSFVAGNVARELGYDFHNWNQRSGDIAKIIGIPYKQGFAEAIFNACAGAGLIKA